MGRTYAMVDGFKGGARMIEGEDGLSKVDSTGLICSGKEATAISKCLLGKGGMLNKKDGSVQWFMNQKDYGVGSAIEVTLRQDGRAHGNWFLNVNANPASVLTGDNTFGSLKLKSQVEQVFFLVLAEIKRGGVDTKRLEQMVTEGEINVHSIAFAVYSSQIKSLTNSRKLFDRWYFMLETRVMNEQQRYVSLLSELGLKRNVGDQFDDSIALSIFSNPGSSSSNKLMSLTLYNKAEEKQAKNREMSKDEHDDLDRRIRFDLTVSNYYLKTHWNLDRITLKNLYQKVKQRWPDLRWQGAVADLMEYAINRTCLLYMVTVPNPFLVKHREMLTLWQKGKNGSKRWDPVLTQWADSIGLNLNVSPMAHMIMLQGQAGLLTQTEDNAKLWLSGKQGVATYLKQMEQVLNQTRESKALAGAVSKLSLDFSKPVYR